ncbi:hypothetical protein PR048_021425 [Dryococelus australis]|uniref:Uncharacterized protein n=1 Tax=Dryococelus australis TaxID=614101 RepID=A0ABQ9GY61_9NEOP|nr:hypothetical protein PR048_021425 [Dryococelus australis]
MENSVAIHYRQRRGSARRRQDRWSVTPVSGCDVVETASPLRDDTSSGGRLLRGLCSCASKVKKRRSDMDDSYTHALRLIAPTRKPMRAKRDEYVAAPECKDGRTGRSPIKPDDQRHRQVLSPRFVRTGVQNSGHVQPEHTATTQQYGQGHTRPVIYGGRGGVVARLLASHQANRVRFPGGDAPGFSHVGTVRDVATGQQVFLRISRFHNPCTLALLHTPSLHLYRLSRVVQASSLTRRETAYSNHNTRQPTGVTVHQHAGTQFANQRLVTYSPGGSPANSKSSASAQ